MNTPRMFAAVIVGILVAYGLPLQLEGVLVRSFAGRNLYTAGDYFMTRNTATLLAARIVITAVTSLLAGYMAARIARTDGVRVVAINPPGTRTDRMTTLLRSEAQQKLGDAERWPELTKHLPFGRPAEPEEVADLAVFLASPRASYISGVVMTLDAGIGARH